MKFAYEIKGVTLDVYDMMRVKEYYEAHCTAEYLWENYNVTEENAVSLGYEVRRLMDKYDYDELTAIDEVVAKEGIEARND